MLKQGIKNLNPKNAFLTNSLEFIKTWRKWGKNRESIRMAGMNKVLYYTGDLTNFCTENSLVDLTGMLNPPYRDDPAHLYNQRIVDY